MVTSLQLLGAQNSKRILSPARSELPSRSVARLTGAIVNLARRQPQVGSHKPPTTNWPRARAKVLQARRPGTNLSLPAPGNNMLCSPIAPATNSSAGSTPEVIAPLANGGGLVASRLQGCKTNSAGTLNVSITNNNNNNNNCHSMRQQNYEMMMQTSEPKGGNNTLIREIKSRNIGSLSPLCQSIAANLNQHTAAAALAAAAAAANSSPAAQANYIIAERRQAISMERLNSIANSTSPTRRYLSQIHGQHQAGGQRARVTSSPFLICGANKEAAGNNNNNSSSSNNNNGSLSSGSNSSIDESASDAERQQDQFNAHHQGHHYTHNNQPLKLMGPARGADRGPGLARSASRVSRFRSAKEFFERLSSVNGNSPQMLPGRKSEASPPAVVFRALRQSPERHFQQQARANVLSRYTNPLAASLTQVTTGGAASAGAGASPLRLGAGALTNHSSSPAINLLPFSKPHQATTRQDPPSQPQAASKQPRETAPSEQPAGAVKPSPNATPSGARAPAAVPRPRSLPLQATFASNVASAASTPPPPPTPTPAKQIGLPRAASLSGAYGVRLKTTDHSGLSTNTILHINNSHLAAGQQEAQGKTVIGGGGGAASPPETPLTFCGDNVIVGGGSLLARRNKQLRIQFEEQLTATFEYLSEEALLDEFNAATRAMTHTGLLQAPLLESNNNCDPAQEREKNSIETTTTTTTTAADCDRLPAAVEEGDEEEEEDENNSCDAQLEAGDAERRPRADHATRAASNPSTMLKRPNAANGSLNTYKPSTLLVDVSSNIDDNLGVRNLVKPAAANGKSQDDQSSGGGRARPALNEWSTNNGSVIYAPTEVVKSHFSKQAASSARESQQLSSTTAAHPKQPNLAKHAPGDGQLSANTANYLTLKPARHGKQLKSQPDPTSDSADAKTLNEESPSTASNWSNGTGTTSDLLF